MKKYWFVVTFGGCAYYSDQTMKSKRGLLQLLIFFFPLLFSSFLSSYHSLLGNIELKKSSCRVVLRGSASEQVRKREKKGERERGFESIWSFIYLSLFFFLSFVSFSAYLV